MAEVTTTDRARGLAHRSSPAHELAKAMEQGSGSAVRLREVPFLTQLALRATPGSAAGAALETTFGVSLPLRNGAVTAGPGGLHVVWLAPDEFLAVAPDEAESGLATTTYVEQASAALGTLRGQVVDVSANRTTFELAGAAARSVLDKSVLIELHPREFSVAQAAATLLGATPAILWRTDVETWRILVRSSFAVHVGSWLLDGMQEYI